MIWYAQEIENTSSVAQLMAATVAVAVAGVGCRCWLFLRPCGLLPPQLRARARRAFKTYSICLVAERQLFFSLLLLLLLLSNLLTQENKDSSGRGASLGDTYPSQKSFANFEFLSLSRKRTTNHRSLELKYNAAAASSNLFVL